MRKVIQFMHVSLDGFVSGPTGGIDWIKGDDEMMDYAGQLTNKSDIALYGRVTFDMMEGYWPTAGDRPNPSKHDIEHSAWYNQVAKVVLSKSMKGKTLNNTTIISENLGDYVRKLKQAGDKAIIIFGSPSASHLLMREGLIDDLWLFVNPILLGKGIPMFKDPGNVKLERIMAHAFNSGVVCLHYKRIAE